MVKNDIFEEKSFWKSSSIPETSIFTWFLVENGSAIMAVQKVFSFKNCIFVEFTIFKVIVLLSEIIFRI